MEECDADWEKYKGANGGPAVVPECGLFAGGAPFVRQTAGGSVADTNWWPPEPEPVCVPVEAGAPIAPSSSGRSSASFVEEWWASETDEVEDLEPVSPFLQPEVLRQFTSDRGITDRDWDRVSSLEQRRSGSLGVASNLFSDPVVSSRGKGSIGERNSPYHPDTFPETPAKAASLPSPCLQKWWPPEAIVGVSVKGSDPEWESHRGCHGGSPVTPDPGSFAGVAVFSRSGGYYAGGNSWWPPEAVANNPFEPSGLPAPARMQK